MFSAITHVAFSLLPVLALLAVRTDGHGRMLEPPSRSSMWRFNYNTPVNYDDNQLFCGGYQVQWDQNGGRCGVCGDPYNGVRENEAGGRYATGTIGRHYSEGQTIPVTIEVTTNHGGFFEFRMCPNNNPSRPVTGEFVFITSNWDCDANNNCCKGCGPQEQFYGCSDVAISPAAAGSHGNAGINIGANTGVNSGGNQGNIGVNPGVHIGANPLANPGSSSGSTCHATVQYRSVYMFADRWCQLQCPLGNCPVQYCDDSCRSHSG